jgi:hypothetical protein
MREVRACDFCGAGAAGVFEVLPAGIDGEARRMLLCESCRDTLDGVVSPLLDALDGVASTDEGVGADPATPEPGESEPAEANGGTETDPAVQETGGRSLRNQNGTPKGYSKVMRFLEGREFPMERATAEELVAEAYGMETETVGAAIDHAAKHGRLREASGKLFR